MRIVYNKIGISDFFRNSKKPEGFETSYSYETLVSEVKRNIQNYSAGYRVGVIIVPIDTKEIRTSIVELTEQTELRVSFESRVPGESPRKHVRALVDQLPPAGGVGVVLYSHETLAEDNDCSSDADWEIVTVLASTSRFPEPMSPATLMANHFKADGGTNTNMSPEDFEYALKVSYNYWKNKEVAELKIPS